MNTDVARETILQREKKDVAAMLKEQDNATPGSAAGSIKSEPPTVKEEPENGEHTDDKKNIVPINGTECKDNSKYLPLCRSPSSLSVIIVIVITITITNITITNIIMLGKCHKINVFKLQCSGNK